MADAGYRLTVDGEAEFKRALADINAQIKLNKSELNALTAEYNANGGSLDTLKAKQAALGTEMGNQQQKVDLMRQRLEEAKDAYGENSAQVVKLQTDLNNASGALETMRRQYNDTSRQIEDATHSTADYDEAVKAADAAIAAEKAELANISAAYKDAADKSGNLADQNKALTAQVEAQQKKVEALSGAMKTAADRFGENSTEANRYREQLAKAESELGKTKDALDKTTKAMEDQSGASGGLMDGLKRLSDQFGIQLPAGMDKMMEGFGNLLGPAGIAGLLTGIAEAAGKLNELGDAAVEDAEKMEDMAIKTGTGSEKLREMLHVADILGISESDMSKGLETLKKKMKEASEGSEDARRYFTYLNTAFEDEQGNLRDTVDVLMDMLEGMKDVGNQADAMRYAEGLLGNSTEGLTELFKAQTGEIVGMMKNVREELGFMTPEIEGFTNRIAAMKRETEAARHSFNNLLGLSFKAWAAGDHAASNAIDPELWKATKNYGSLLWRSITGAYARGTAYHPGGLALVGEQGPEIVDLPQGSKVYPTGTGPSGGTTNNYYEITIDASRIRELQDIVRIAENERVSRRMGVAK